MKEMEQPRMDRRGDGGTSFLNTPPSGAAPEPEVAVVPPVELPTVNLEPPVLEPPPPALAATPPLPPVPQETYRVVPNAPVIVDAQPQRVPSFPRPLEPARPADTIPGTQVYRLPETTARVPDLPGSGTTARSASQAPASSGASGAPPYGGMTARPQGEPAYASPAPRSEPAQATSPRSRSEPAHGTSPGARSEPAYVASPGTRSEPARHGDSTATLGAGPARAPVAVEAGRGASSWGHGDGSSFGGSSHEGRSASASVAESADHQPVGQASGSVSVPAE